MLPSLWQERRMRMSSRWLKDVKAGVSMSESEASACLRVLLGGEVSDEQMAELLVALAEKGETADEVVGFCRVLQESAQPLTLTQDCMDVCGTGGSGLSRYQWQLRSAGCTRLPLRACRRQTQGVVRADRRTIFNLAAPLSNPAMPAFQVVGTPTQTNAQLLAGDGPDSISRMACASAGVAM